MQGRALSAGGERWFCSMDAARRRQQAHRPACPAGQRLEEEEGKLPAPSGSLVAAGAP